MRWGRKQKQWKRQKKVDEGGRGRDGVEAKERAGKRQKLLPGLIVRETRKKDIVA